MTSSNWLAANFTEICNKKTRYKEGQEADRVKRGIRETKDKKEQRKVHTREEIIKEKERNCR
jgi:hypothetical protein